MCLAATAMSVRIPRTVATPTPRAVIRTVRTVRTAALADRASMAMVSVAQMSTSVQLVGTLAMRTRLAQTRMAVMSALATLGIPGAVARART